MTKRDRPKRAAGRAKKAAPKPDPITAPAAAESAPLAAMRADAVPPAPASSARAAAGKRAGKPRNAASKPAASAPSDPSKSVRRANQPEQTAPPESLVRAAAAPQVAGPTIVPAARLARELAKQVATNGRSHGLPGLITSTPVVSTPLGGDEQAGDEQAWANDEPSGALPPSADELMRSGVSDEDRELTSRLARGSSGDRLREAADFGSSQSLLSTDYYFRQYGARGLRSLAAEVDDFGFDPHVDAKVRPLLETLARRYFRVELIGAENVPAHGRALLVANRSGALPWDGLMLRTSLRAQRPELTPLRWLAEDSVIQYPFMGVLMNRLGAVRACPENAERLLEQDRLIAVFPEGAQGSRKLFRDRYRLQRFGRGGYVKLALKLGVPILPTAIIGAEETNPVLRRSRVLGRMFGSESLPITPTFPWLGVAGLLPAPVRWRIVIGAPLDLSRYGTQSADDALIVHRLNEQIRSSLQALVDESKAQRGGALFG